VVAGLQFNFALPFGATFNFAPLYYAEKNHSAFITVNSVLATSGQTSGVDYFNTWRVEGALIVPLGPKGTPLTFGSLFGINGPKGQCPQGSCAATAVPTKTEYFTQQSLTLDVGQLAYGKPNIFSIFVAYVYWQNKFGIDHDLDKTGGTTESTMLTGATVRF
jgi:hypothetical protein